MTVYFSMPISISVGKEQKGMPAGELAAKEIWEGAEGLSLSTPGIG
jgi:hypothetical protein